MPASNEGSNQTASLGHEQQLAQPQVHLDTAMLAMQAIQAGTLGFGGATASVLRQNFTAMRNVIDRS
jgi:hypothetical protein